jgi:hypothetical protein
MRYGAAFYVIFLPTGAVRHGELTKGALGRRGNRRVARDGGLLFLKLGDGESSTLVLLWLLL